MKLNKEIIKKRFKKNLKTYNNYAIVQRQMADSLINFLTKITLKNKFNNILELGCGTGLLTKNIKDKLIYKNLYLNDIVEDLDPFFQNFLNIQFFPGDIESCNLPTNNDLIISNATFQWLQNIQSFLIKIKNNLKKNSFLVFSTFGEKNLIEFKKIGNLSLHYHTLNKYLEFLEKDYQVIFSKENIIKIYQNTPLDILKNLKYTGVTGIRNNFWTKKDLNSFTNNYNNNFKADNKVSLTFHPIFIIAKIR